MAEKTIHLKRTSLYASGASPVNMIQAIFYNEDMLIYDLEDSVPASEKDAARFLVYNMVKNKEISNVKAMQMLGLKKTTYFKLKKQYEDTI